MCINAIGDALGQTYYHPLACGHLHAPHSLASDYPPLRPGSVEVPTELQLMGYPSPMGFIPKP